MRDKILAYLLTVPKGKTPPTAGLPSILATKISRVRWEIFCATIPTKKNSLATEL